MNSSEIIFAVPASLTVLWIRFALEKFVMRPLGIYLGIKPGRSRKILKNPRLEKAYKESQTWSRDQIIAMCKEEDLSPRKVERWLKVRRGYASVTTLDKFCESFWKGTYYSFSWIYSSILLWNKRWNIREFWTENEVVTSAMWWHCTITFGFYLSLCIRQIINVKRKDFWELFIHHVLVILITMLVSMFGLYHLGSLCLFIHDLSDVFLEFSKCVKYLDYIAAANVGFVFFLISWLITRTGIYPFWLLKNCLEDSEGILAKSSVYYTWNGLLLIILCFHCFWTFFILKFTVCTIRYGTVQDDIRSDSDSSKEDIKAD